MPSPSSSISSLLTRILDRLTGTRVGPLRFRQLGGGSINQAYQVLTSGNRLWFCKINDAGRFPDLFTREGQGLELLGRQGLIRVPAVIACEEAEGLQVLVLEWITEGQRNHQFWTRFGEQLANLHRGTNNFRSPPSSASTTSRPSPGASFPGSPAASDSSPDGTSLSSHGGFSSSDSSNAPLPGPPFSPSRPLLGPSHPFGLGQDNYIGSLPQSNTPSADWPSFFIGQRLQPQLRLSFDQGLLDAAAVRKFEALYLALPDIFAETLPSLNHGDLWSGNFLCDENSRPVLIDPAVYYGHRSMDLAMTTLFGGFGPGFYEAYNYHFPFPANYRQQWEICNLYPLLVHLNLFGESYKGNILRTIQPF